MHTWRYDIDTCNFGHPNIFALLRNAYLNFFNRIAIKIPIYNNTIVHIKYLLSN